MKAATLRLAGVAAVALACTGPTPGLAQSNIQLYGVLDTGIEFVTHAGPSGNNLWRVPGITGTMPSRWGIRGSEDLGGGLHALFTLENGFNVRAGDVNQGGRLFGRQSWVGLQNDWGTLSFGRQYSMTFWALSDADILGPDIYGGLGSFDAYIPNARSDNTVAYKGTWQGLTVGATWSFGRDSGGTGNSPGQGTCAGNGTGANGSPACRQWSAMLRYDASAFGVAAAYDQQRGGPGAAASFFDGVSPVAITGSGATDARIQLNAYVKGDKWKVGGGWLGRRVSTDAPTLPGVNSDMFYLTASYAWQPQFVIDGGVYRIVNTQHDTRGTIAALRGTWLLSRRSAVYLQSGYLFNSAHAAYTLSQGGAGASPNAGVNQLGVMAGVRHTF
jgi:predicted porin